MALSEERIRELWENYSPTKGIESFARSVEAEARRDALEEAAKMVVETKEWKNGKWTSTICPTTADAIAASIRKLKEDIQ